jgi:hypothetical protein
VPFLLDGMDSENISVRYHSLTNFACTFIPKYATELVPRLRRLLKDRLPDTRLSAAVIAGRYPELRPDLQAAYERELPSPVRDAMARALKEESGIRKAP